MENQGSRNRLQEFPDPIPQGGSNPQHFRLFRHSIDYHWTLSREGSSRLGEHGGRGPPKSEPHLDWSGVLAWRVSCFPNASLGRKSVIVWRYVPISGWECTSSSLIPQQHPPWHRASPPCARTMAYYEGKLRRSERLKRKLTSEGKALPDKRIKAGCEQRAPLAKLSNRARNLEEASFFFG